jgi:hypothetical protein
VAWCDTSATWCTPGTLCRERDWSKPRLLYELQNGLPYRTIPPGHVIDWHDPRVVRSFDVEAGTVRLLLGVLDTNAALGFNIITVGIEVLRPPPAVATAAGDAIEAADNATAAGLVHWLSSGTAVEGGDTASGAGTVAWLGSGAAVEAADTATAAAAVALASAQWAAAATRRLRDEGKTSDSMTKADLCRLLEAEAPKAVRLGQIKYPLKASYLENQLAAWGIWPLSSFE